MARDRNKRVKAVEVESAGKSEPPIVRAEQRVVQEG